MTPVCAALLAGLAGPVASEPTCGAVDLDLAGRFAVHGPERALPVQFSLPRSRLELGVAEGPGAARVAVTGTRAGGSLGPVGVVGESFVPALQVVEARIALPDTGWSVRAGLVDDLWIVTGNASWAREVAPVLGEDQGWLDRSDLGAQLLWGGAAGRVQAAVSTTSGEGASRSERNGRVNLSGVLVLRPFTGERADRLVLSAVQRAGWRGLSAARDHRTGLRVSTTTPALQASAELLVVAGLDGDALRWPIGASGLAVWTPPATPVLAFARLDAVAQTPGGAAGREWAVWAGGGWQPAADLPVRVELGVHHRERRADAAVLAGADALGSETMLFAQVATRLRVVAAP